MGSGLSEDDLKRRLRHQLGLDPDSGTPVTSADTGDRSLTRFCGQFFCGSSVLRGAGRMASRGADVVVDSGGSDQRSW